MKTLGHGDLSRNGLYQITDMAWNTNGTLRVTVREMIGERELPKSKLEAMRRFARRALPSVSGTKTIRTWYAQGCSHATFTLTPAED